ncbi:MAG: DUF4652 domain-containing protein [Eubacteriales bacterium]|nr:DUF4652 domain-containing protein [Eubacteriales bacterium]
MKKIALLILFVLVFTLFGCTNNNPEESMESLTNNASEVSESTECSENSGNTYIINTKIKELENEIDRLNTLLSSSDGEKADLSDKIKSLEDEVSVLKNSAVKEEKIKVKDGVYLTLREDHSSQPWYTLSIEYEDKTVVEVIKLNYIWTVKASPEGTKVILNDAQMEYTAQVFMYDVEKRETRKLLMPNLPRDRTAVDMEWLDDRYFLFVVQLDHGSVVRGGDTYVYDTQTDEYKVITKSEDWKFQTHGFDVYGEDFVVVNSYLYEDTMNFTEDKYHILTFDEIYDLINSNKVLDLNKIESKLS